MMQWDPVEMNFHFHEIVMAHIDAVTQAVPVSADAPTGMVEIFPARERGISVDEQRCTRCHSTRNIRNPNPSDRGTSVPSGTPPVVARSKPNWDAWDNWRSDAIQSRSDLPGIGGSRRISQIAQPMDLPRQPGRAANHRTARIAAAGGYRRPM